MNDRPKRIQRHRKAGWRLPANTIYVGRGTRWGTPWVLAQLWWAEDPAQASIEVYRDTIIRHLHRNPGFLAPLRGKDLACYCSLGQPCHADVLLELANRLATEQQPQEQQTCPPEAMHAPDVAVDR